MEEVFKNFGKIMQDGVAIRTQRYVLSFVEFEDIAGVHNAIKARLSYIIYNHLVFVDIAGVRRHLLFRSVGCNSPSKEGGHIELIYIEEEREEAPVGIEV